MEILLILALKILIYTVQLAMITGMIGFSIFMIRCTIKVLKAMLTAEVIKKEGDN